MLAAELNPHFRTCTVFVSGSATDMLIRLLRFHITFFSGNSESSHSIVVGLFIAHVLGMDCGNRAGNSLALADGDQQRRPGCRHLSLQCMQCAARVSGEHIALQFGLILVCCPSAPTPNPVPNPLLKAFVLQLHISLQLMSPGVGGCMG